MKGHRISYDELMARRAAAAQAAATAKLAADPLPQIAVLEERLELTTPVARSVFCNFQDLPPAEYLALLRERAARVGVTG